MTAPVWRNCSTCLLTRAITFWLQTLPVPGVLLILLVLNASRPNLDSAAASPPQLAQHRRPVAGVLIRGHRTLCIANRRSGTLSTIDTATLDVTEQPLGQQLSDVVVVPQTQERRLLVTDFAGHQLIDLVVTESGISVRKRLDVASSPASVCVNSSGTRAGVASLWSRRVSLFERLDDDWKRAAEIDLPFAPRASAFLNPKQFVVADSFGGRFAVIDTASRRIVAQHELPLHNVRDLRVADGQLFLTYQRLDPRAQTDHESIHWGVLIQNEAGAIPIRDLLATNPGFVQAPKLPQQWALGEAGDGAGDPEALVVTGHRLLVTYGGTGELALIDRVGIREVRLPVGDRPVDLVFDASRSRAFVINELSDSVTVLDLDNGETAATVTLGPAPEPGPVERGERAFFNARLSLEGWMSCHSCHTDGHTSNRLSDTLGDGSYGVARRIPTLRGVWATAPWSWNGSQFLLHTQISRSLTTTMRHGEARDELVSDLVAYVTTLERAPSLLAARGEELHPSVGYQRRQLFEDAGCSACHNGFTSYTSDGTYDVGLRDAFGNTKFNPPSLSSVSQRDRLLHDGSASSLEEVFGRFKHPPGTELTSQQRQWLTEFLLGL